MPNRSEKYGMQVIRWQSESKMVVDRSADRSGVDTVGRSAVQTGMTMVCEYIGGRSEEDGTWGRSAVQTGKTIGRG